MNAFVFSAHAEVVPKAKKMPGILDSILRARGGSSTPTELTGRFALYSPRTRR